MGVLVRVLERGGKVLVNVCDPELLGRVFREGEVVLDVREGYFGGEEMEGEDVVEELRRGDYITLVGEESVGYGVLAGYVPKGAWKRVRGVPFIFVYKV